MSKLGSRDTLVAAVVYYACLISRTPRSMGEVATFSGVPMKRISKMIQIITKDQSKLLNHSQDDKRSTELSVSSTPTISSEQEWIQQIKLKPEDLIGRMASQLNINSSLISIGRIICHNILQYDLMNGNSPQTVAIGVLLLILVATGGQWIMEHLTKVSFCSEKSIKKIYSQLQQDSVLILPNDFIKSIGGLTRIPLQLPNEPS